MLELEALRDENQRVKEDSRQNEERVTKLEAEIKKFSLFFLSSESRPNTTKPKKEDIRRRKTWCPSSSANLRMFNLSLLTIFGFLFLESYLTL